TAGNLAGAHAGGVELLAEQIHHGATDPGLIHNEYGVRERLRFQHAANVRHDRGVTRPKRPALQEPGGVAVLRVLENPPLQCGERAPVAHLSQVQADVPVRVDGHRRWLRGGCGGRRAGCRPCQAGDHSSYSRATGAMSVCNAASMSDWRKTESMAS